MKNLGYIFIFSLLLALTSCSSLEKKVKIEKIANIELKGFSGLKATAIVTNESGRNLELRDVELTLKKNGERVAVLSLVDEVITVPRRSESIEVATLWRLGKVDLSNAISFKEGVTSQELEGFRVDIKAFAKAGSLKRDINIQNIALKNLVEDMRR